MSSPSAPPTRTPSAVPTPSPENDAPCPNASRSAGVAAAMMGRSLVKYMPWARPVRRRASARTTSVRESPVTTAAPATSRIPKTSTRFRPKRSPRSPAGTCMATYP